MVPVAAPRQAGSPTRLPAPVPPPTPRPPTEVARRPSIGAVRRKKEAAAPAPAPAAPPRPKVHAAPDPVAEPPDTGFAAAAHAGKPAQATQTLDRDSLTAAWGDGILQSLPARAKARYASGRFVAVDGEGAHFALPNAAHREQCAEQQAVVEKALSDHFGTTVTLVLDIDDTSPPPAARSGPSPAAAGPSSGAAPSPAVAPAEEIDYVHPSELDDTSTDQASAAQARLLQAFPGASEVPE